MAALVFSEYMERLLPDRGFSTTSEERPETEDRRTESSSEELEALALMAVADGDWRPWPRSKTRQAASEKATVDEAELNGEPELTEMGARRPGKSWDEMSRVDAIRRRQAVEKVAERVHREEAEHLTFAPSLDGTKGETSRVGVALQSGRRKLEAKRRFYAEKEVEQCSFSPQVLDCPTWVTKMAAASRTRKAKRADLQLNEHLVALELKHKQQLKTAHGPALHLLQQKHATILRNLKRRGRVPSPPPAWRY